jgi:hypothetical protein
MKCNTSPKRQSFVGQIRKEMTDMKSVMRMTGLLLVAFADGIEDELRDAIEKGCKITYEIRGTLPPEAASDSEG